MKLIVGIDFGTSTTVVRYKVEGTDIVYSVKDADGISDTIPTVIFKCVDGSSTTVYGSEALNMSRNGMQGELISNFKMGLLDADEQTRTQKEAYIEEFLAFVYKRFAEETVKYAGYDMDIYISFPAKWSDGFVTFMKEAYRKAGFKGNIIGVNEPKAATFNMLFRHLDGFKHTKLLTPNKPMNVFMLDMGAGTTDIVIFRLLVDSQGKIEIDNLLTYPTVDNPYLCGGREIDGLLQKYVLSSIADKRVPFGEDGFTMDHAKRWKDAIVSAQLKKGMVLPLPPELMQIMKFMPNGKEVINSFTLSALQFESATAEHWRNLYELISSAIVKYKEKYNVGAEDIDMLFLTGGHSQWYTIPNLFNGVGVNGVIGVDYKTSQGDIKALDFKKLKSETWRMFGDARPHECVATGLCLQDSIPNLQSEPITTCANNVWLQIEINGVKSEPCKVVSVDDELPMFVDDFSIRLGHIKKELYSEEQKKPFVGTFIVYTGEDLQTAQISQYKTEIDFGFWKFVLCDMFLITSKCDLIVREDNTIGIKGSVTFDPESIVFNAESVSFGNGFDEKHIFDPCFNKNYAGNYQVELLSVNKDSDGLERALWRVDAIGIKQAIDMTKNTPSIVLSNISAYTAKCLKAKIEAHGGNARVTKIK